MAQRNGPPPIVFILLFLLLAGGGYWWFFMRSPAPEIASGSPDTPPPPTSNTNTTTPPTNTGGTAFPAPNSVPGGTTVRLTGSTSMVAINQNLKQAFERQFPNTIVAASAGGSDKGIEALLAGTADVAAVSRPLTSQEQSQGLVAIPVAQDRIALVVGINNPFTGSLTSQQVKQIFQGQMTNWSEVGGPNAPIQVINRPPVSGTRQAFQEMVLNGEEFGNTPNITTLERDATTPMLQQLGQNGIGYATYAQIANQQTVRSLPIDSQLPNSPDYPFQRPLFYVYKEPATPTAQAFLGYALSPEGQQAIVGQ